jgi:hypothetical protein
MRAAQCCALDIRRRRGSRECWQIVCAHLRGGLVSRHASLIKAGSLKAVPKKLMPSGTPNTTPATSGLNNKAHHNAHRFHDKEIIQRSGIFFRLLTQTELRYPRERCYGASIMLDGSLFAGTAFWPRGG